MHKSFKTSFHTLVCTLILCLLPSLHAHAQVSADHIYLEADYGYAWYEFDESKQKDDKSVRYTLGYHFSHASAIELSYLDFGTVNNSLSDVTTTGWTIASKNRYSLSNAFSIFARVGYGKLEADYNTAGENTTKTNNDFFYGFGMELVPLNTISFQISYDIYKLESYDNGYASIGLIYRLTR